MAGNGNKRRTRSQKETISTTAASWSTPVKLGRLGRSGRLSRTVIRYGSGTSMTAADLLIFVGGTDETGTTVANIPDEDIILKRTGVAITGSATAADDDYDCLSNHNGIGYDAIADIDNPTEEGALWVSVKPTGSGTENVVFLATAIDVA